MTSARTLWVATYTTDSGRDGVGIGAVRFVDGSVASGGAGGGVQDARVTNSGEVGAGEVGADLGGADLGGADLGGAAAADGEQGDAARVEWLGRAVDAPSPSFVAVHPTLPVVYAVAERAQTVAAFRSVDDVDGVPQLEPLGSAWPAGEAVCHVAVDNLGRFVTATCWGDGRVLLYELASDGALISRFEGAPAADPHAESAAAEADTQGMLARTGFAPRTSRAHCSLMLPDGRIMTTDLGFDLVRVWSYTPGTGLVLDHEIVLPFWSGPRHLIAHPNGTVLIITEYSVEVVVLAPGAPAVTSMLPAAAEAGARPARVASMPASPNGESASGSAIFGVAQVSPPTLRESASAAAIFGVAQIGPATARGAQPFDAGAEIALSTDAAFMYVTVRGSNSVSTLRVDDRGRVHPLADVSSGGDWPRHHLVLGHSLLIAHERSSQLTLFTLDPATGLPTGPTQQLAVEAPTGLAVA
ncbi:lactonase family protein [Subtercola lobariae]|uniref:3-carboxymuconate cyclase n=1 Tax=Subtercola lobariae TaxID=1588641 RepID=A0A917BBS1_9MICO|nr:beta-propeller fold lactonase family protein [Subtercola lobariae]GGF35876.1 hypothetical protein GCM10011399_31080 [Subtercola lobariae]